MQQFKQRRERLLRQMAEGSIAFLTASKSVIRNGDLEYPFRQGSNFYYLTGFTEPEAIAVLIPGRSEGEYILFCRPTDAELERWSGPRTTPQVACEYFGADQAYTLNQFDEIVFKLLRGCEHVYYPIGKDHFFDQRLQQLVKQVKQESHGREPAPSEYSNLNNMLHEMRLIKDAKEISNMRNAARISALAHQHVMQQCRPGMMEYELEAVLLYEFVRHGSGFVAYDSIVAAGGNAGILHYTANDCECRDGDLVLIDAGCEYRYYASDVTRTIPVNGKFNAEQRTIYQLVLDTQLAVIDAIKPGVTLHTLQNISTRCITEGLVDLGLLSGSIDQLIEQKTFQRFYMHGVSHWLGMDVHDVGDYKVGQKWRELQAGMVFTVEPGIYIGSDLADVDEKWWNIGVRIEDDIAITTDGVEILSNEAPKKIADIEALMTA